MWTAIPCIHFHHVKISYWNPLLFSIFLNNSGIVNCHLQHSWLEISLMVLSESSIHRKKLSVRYLIHFPLPCSKTFLLEQFHVKGLLGVRYIFWSFIRPKKRFYKKLSFHNWIFDKFHGEVLATFQVKCCENICVKKFQISGTTFEEALPLFCHHLETAIVTKFSSNASNTVFRANALRIDSLSFAFCPKES